MAMDDETFDKLRTGDRVHMEAVGTVIHVHGNGRVDIRWEGSRVENSVDRALLTKFEQCTAMKWYAENHGVQCQLDMQHVMDTDTEDHDFGE